MFNYLVFAAVVGIWIMISINAVLLIAGYFYYLETERNQIDLLEDKDCPTVTILIPAHNEEKVIGRTVLSMISLNYPADKLEIIVINDNSSDKSAKILAEIKEKYPN